MKSEEIIIYRQKNRLRNIFIFLILLIMVIWSVDVTIVEDTDWERMGSLSDVLSSAGRFIGIDFSLFPDLIVPSIETFMISILGTFVGVIICIPATWFGAKNITPFKPLTYPLGRLLMTLVKEMAFELRVPCLCNIHDVQLATEFCNKIVGIQEGTKMFEGDPNNLSEEKLNEIYAMEVL